MPLPGFRINSGPRGSGSGQARVSHKTHAQLVQLLGYAPTGPQCSRVGTAKGTKDESQAGATAGFWIDIDYVAFGWMRCSRSYTRPANDHAYTGDRDTNASPTYSYTYSTISKHENSNPFTHRHEHFDQRADDGSDTQRATLGEESQHANRKVRFVQQRGRRQDLCHWGYGWSHHYGRV